MTRRLVLAIVVAGVLFALGVYIERRWITREMPELPLTSSAQGRTTADPNGRSSPNASMTLELSGQVEHRSHLGNWHPLSVGAAIGIDDEIRTGSGSVARLQLGMQVIVELAENTTINVAQLSQTLSRVRLQDGRVLAEVRGSDDFRFRVQVQGNNGQAETGAGRFGVMRRGSGPAVFASESGDLEVTGAGKSVRLQAGEQTQVFDGGAPSAPTKLPKSLLLKLGQAPPSRLRTRKTQVTGDTSPGAVVTVGGQYTVPNGSGHFTNTVALVDGANDIVVQVEDVLGRTDTKRFPRVTVDAKAPNVAGKVVW